MQELSSMAKPTTAVFTAQVAYCIGHDNTTAWDGKREC